MAISVYLVLIILLVYMASRYGSKPMMKHSGYTKLITPAVLLPLRSIMKKDYFNTGGKLMFLYGKNSEEAMFKIHWAAKISSFLMFSGYPVIYLSLGKPGFAEIALALVIPVIGFSIPDLELSSKIAKKKNAIMSDYPVFCTDLAVMAGAGLDIMEAWARASYRESDGVLYYEARKVLLRTRTGTLFRDALKEFSANLPMPEIHTFVTIICQEIKSGSGGIDNKLRECAFRSWKTREDFARKKGEEAASKIIFPLSLGLIGILLILASPAVLIMKGL